MLKYLAMQKIVSSHKESAKLQEIAGLCLFKNQNYETGAKLTLMITPALLFVPDRRVPASFLLVKKEGLNKDSGYL